MAIIENADYTLTGEQVVDLRDRVKSALQLPGTVIGNGAPTTSTEGNVGQFYYDTTNDKLYYCKAKTAQGTDPETYVYTWEENPDTTYSAGANISISEQNVISAIGLPTVLTDPEYEELWAEPIPPVPDTYGTVSHYSVFSVEWDANAMECTVDNIDETQLEAYLATQEDTGMVSFMYQEIEDPETGEPTGEYGWYFGWGPEGDPIANEDMPIVTGITVTLDEGAEFAEIMLDRLINIDTTSEIAETEILSQAELEGLGNVIGQDYVFTIGGGQMPCGAITSFEFGTISSFEMPEGFLGNCWQMTSISGDFPSGITEIPTYFLNNDSELASTSSIDLSNVTAIGEGFMMGCSVFDGAITMPQSAATVDGHFMEGCGSFNHALDMSHITRIGGSFLLHCNDFNQPLVFAPGAVIDGEAFLNSASYFNQPLDFSNCTFAGNATGQNFLGNCSAFNSALTLPSTITTISSGFMYNCTLLTQMTVTIPNGVTSIKADFMRGCFNYNKPMVIPDSVTSIGDNFMYNQGTTYPVAFNSAITLSSNLTTIGAYFMAGLRSFNQGITLPASLTAIGMAFMYRCDSMVSTVNVGSLDPAIVTDSYGRSFATNQYNAPCYVTGITVSGANAAAWKTKFYDNPSDPYRKILLAS